MRRRLWLVAILGTTILAAKVSAQDQDTGQLGGPRAEVLRRLIEERFAERLVVELGLTDDQGTKVRTILAGWGNKRRTLEQQERRSRQRLQVLMRPGVAADEQAVTRVVDEIMNGRLAYVQTFKDELVDLAAVLSPVQRAQYVLLRDRLMQRVQEVRNQAQTEGAGPLRRNRLRP